MMASTESLQLLDLNNNNNAVEKSLEDSLEVEKPWYHVNKTMLACKFSFFFLNAKDSSYLPYFNLFLLETGLNPGQAGLISGLRLVGNIIGSPFWCYIADRKNLHRSIGLIAPIMSLLCMIIQPFITILIGNNSMNVSHNTSVTNMKLYNNATELIPVIINDSIIVDQSMLFYSLLLINVISTFFDGCMLSLVESSVMIKIQENPKKLDFGKERLFGAIGFSIGNLVSSIALKFVHFEGINPYIPIFFVYVVCMVSFIVSSQYLLHQVSVSRQNHQAISKIIKDVDSRQNLQNSDPEHKNDQSLTAILFQGEMLFFLATSLIFGYQLGINVYYLFLFLKELKTDHLIMGFCIFVSSISSMLGFRFSKSIITLFHDIWLTMIICLFSYTIRFIVTAFAFDPWIILIVQCAQAFGFGVYIATSINFIQSLVEQNLLSTMCSILYSLHFGIGPILASIIGGYLYKNYGGPFVFKFTAFISAVWIVLMVIYVSIKRCCKKSNPAIIGEGENEIMNNNNV